MSEVKINFINKQVDLEELSQSPFKIYEDMFCSKCEDYKGCLGLIDSSTMEIQNADISTGSKSMDSMVKSMGGLTFSVRFKMILDCARLRELVC